MSDRHRLIAAYDEQRSHCAVAAAAGAGTCSAATQRTTTRRDRRAGICSTPRHCGCNTRCHGLGHRTSLSH